MSLSEKRESPPSTMPGDDAIRPGAIILTLVLFGVGTLFAGLSAAYLFTLFSSGVDAPRPPLLFLVNVPILIAATFFLRKSRRDFSPTTRDSLKHGLLICLGLTLLFTAIQTIGWILFFRRFSMQESQLTSFLFILSALHLLHVLAGIPFLSWYVLNTWKDRLFRQKPVKFWQRYLKGLGRYWRFLDILWVLLVIVLWVGYGITAFK